MKQQCDRNPRTCSFAPTNQMIHSMRNTILRWPSIRKSLVCELLRLGANDAERRLPAKAFQLIDEIQKIFKGLEEVLQSVSVEKSRSRKNRVSKLNQRIAEKMSAGLSTMWCLWIVLLLVLFPLIWNRPDTLYGWAQYLSTAVFQAVALPVLAFVSREETRKQMRILNETRNAEMEELKLLRKDRSDVKEEK